MSPQADGGPAVELFVDAPMDGATNMARDEWLLARATPAIRLYGWAPACVSLGRTQTESDVDRGAAERLGIDVVPRKTGGGAILHNEAEVTYAVVLPLDFPGLPPSILESYRFISEAVCAAFRALGIDAVFGEGKGGRDTLCYLREEGVSIFVDGKKISGGAQRRTQRAVLQHGTMVVALDAERTAAVLRASVEAVRAKVTGLDALGVEATRDQVLGALRAAFAERFDLVPGQWPAEARAV